MTAPHSSTFQNNLRRKDAVLKRKLIGILLSALVAVGLVGSSIGSGSAEAAVVTGKYQQYDYSFGVVPGPPSNVRITKNRMYRDLYGVGPKNFEVLLVIPRSYGMTVTYYNDPVSLWYSRIDFHKTRTGYKGIEYSMGVPVGDIVLREVR